MRKYIGVVLAVLASAGAAHADFYSLLDAARLRDLAAVQRWLAAGDDPNPSSPRDGYSPLQFAAGNGEVEMTRLLLAAGADTEYRDHNGDRALLWAADGQPDTARLLLEAGSPADASDDPYGRTPLMIAAQSGNAETVHLLLTAGADVAALDQTESAPLHYAALARIAGPVTLLLEAGADANAITEILLETPLHLATGYGSPESVVALVAAGAKLEARDSDGRTALFVAAQRGDADTAAILLAAGAEVDARDAAGATGLMFAALRGEVDVARVLLAHGADPALRDGTGQGLDFYLSYEPSAPPLDHGRSAALVLPPDPAEIAKLRAAHSAIRELLAAR